MTKQAKQGTATVISWAIVAITLVGLYFAFSGVAVYASL